MTKVILYYQKDLQICIQIYIVGVQHAKVL